MPDALDQCRDRLRAVLRRHTPLLVAYSGGVDSAYLAWEAYQVLGAGMTAVIADSPSLPRRELEAATAFARQHGIPLRTVRTAEMDSPAYVANDGARCFHCKDELFRRMGTLAAESNAVLAYGRNLDDAGDFRPGQAAAAQHRVIAPLVEAGLGKAEVRALAEAAGLAVWNKPASACLASRIEYGRPVTAEALRQVEASEALLASLGFRQVRVRHHGPLARIEIEQSELPRALSTDMLDRMSAGIRSAGFTFVALDTQGYRSGSMNAVLPVESLLRATRANGTAA